jgi:hypothetical protein
LLCHACGFLNTSERRICSQCGTKLRRGEPARPSPAGAPKPVPAPGPPPMPVVPRPVPTPPVAPTRRSGSPNPDTASAPEAPAVPVSGPTPPAHPTVRVDGLPIAGVPSGGSISAPAVPPTLVVTLEDEARGESHTFRGTAITLGRADLDPHNTTLSAAAHVAFRDEDGQVRVEDRSSTGATFLQVTGPTPVEDGTRILLGNRIFRVRITRTGGEV